MKALVMDDKGNLQDPETGEEVVRSDMKDMAEKKLEEDSKGTPKVEEKKEIIENKVDSPEKPKVYTKYEVNPDSVFYIKFGTLPRDGRVLVIAEDDVDFEKNAEKHWVKFKMWSYDKELEWKNSATEYDSSKRVHSLNADKLSEMKIRNLLLDWSFGESQDSLKLFHVNGLLTDESLKTFYSLFPTVVRHVVEGMNDVLEFNN